MCPSFHCVFFPIPDREAPIITCPNDVTTTAFPGEPFANLSWTPPTAHNVTDNSGELNFTVWCSNDTDVYWEIGIHTIYCWTFDSSGNKGMCSFRGTVLGKFDGNS